MRLTIVADPDLFVIGDAEVDTNDDRLILPLEFAKPLMRDIEIPRHGNANTPPGKSPQARRRRRIPFRLIKGTRFSGAR